MAKGGPSSVPPGERYIVRLYMNDAHDPEVYENVKHCWVTEGGVLLAILHYWAADKYRYLYWPMARVRWYQVMPMRFEAEA